MTLFLYATLLVPNDSTNRKEFKIYLHQIDEFQKISFKYELLLVQTIQFEGTKSEN